MNEVMTNTKEVVDVLEAVNIALSYLSHKGIVVFTREVRSVFRNSLVWVVEIDSEQKSGRTFTGVILIKVKTREVVKELAL